MNAAGMLLKEAEQRLTALFNVDEENAVVTIMLVGEKRGHSLFVQGEEFTSHESDPAE
jgi:hypothetical protein